VNLDRTIGFLVADARGRVVGKVEGPMYGRVEDVPDALAVRSGFFSRRRRLVPAETIVEIDDRSRVVGLGVDREAIRSLYRVGRCNSGRTSRAERRRRTSSSAPTHSGSNWVPAARRSSSIASPRESALRYGRSSTIAR
jgi:hypothetical protein